MLSYEMTVSAVVRIHSYSCVSKDCLWTSGGYWKVVAALRYGIFEGIDLSSFLTIIYLCRGT